MPLQYGDPIDPNKNANEKELGARIRQMRERRGWTQEKLAEESGLAHDTVRRAERGTFSASLRTLTKIAAGFSIPVHLLLHDGLDEADDLAASIRALNEYDFRVAVEIVNVLRSLSEGLGR